MGMIVRINLKNTNPKRQMDDVQSMCLKYPFHSIPQTVVLALGESAAQKDLLRGKWNVRIDSFLDPDEKKLNFTSREKDGDKMSVSFIRYLERQRE